MSDEQEKNLKNGVKKGASVVGKVIKWVLIAILLIVVAVVAYSCYTCTAVTKAVVDATSDSRIVREAVRDATGGSETSSSRAASGPTSINVDDPKDIPFIHNESRIQVNQTYEITVDTWFRSISGTMLILGLDSEPYSTQTFSLEVKSRIPDFERGTPVRVVFLYNPGRFISALSFVNSELVSIERR